MCAASVHTCHGVCAPYYTPPPPADECDRTRHPSSRAAAAVLTAVLIAALVEVLTVMVALLASLLALLRP